VVEISAHDDRLDQDFSADMDHCQRRGAVLSDGVRRGDPEDHHHVAFVVPSPPSEISPLLAPDPEENP
jgi:hypothetical protein